MQELYTAAKGIAAIGSYFSRKDAAMALLAHAKSVGFTKNQWLSACGV